MYVGIPYNLALPYLFFIYLFVCLFEEKGQYLLINILTNVNAPESAERLIFIGSPFVSC